VLSLSLCHAGVVTVTLVFHLQLWSPELQNVLVILFFFPDFFLALLLFSAGELSAAELENLMVIVAEPRQFRDPRLVPEQAKGSQGRALLAGGVQHHGSQDEGGPGEAQKIRYCSLFTVHCSLFTVHCSLFTVTVTATAIVTVLYGYWYPYCYAVAALGVLFPVFLPLPMPLLLPLPRLRLAVCNRNHRGLRHYWGVRVLLLPAFLCFLLCSFQAHAPSACGCVQQES